MMTTQEFKDRLQGLVALGDDFGALVFFAIRNEDGIVLKKANIINDVFGLPDCLTERMIKYVDAGVDSQLLGLLDDLISCILIIAVVKYQTCLEM